MFLQMPIWFGLNTVLRFAIEMRHARWFGWISDLSSKDPYYILPITMGLSMYLVSKMTPMTTTDPQQQMMMKIMPVTMAGLFMISPISSGLAVYILTSSLVGIPRSWMADRTLCQRRVRRATLLQDPDQTAGKNISARPLDIGEIINSPAS